MVAGSSWFRIGEKVPVSRRGCRNQVWVVAVVRISLASVRVTTSHVAAIPRGYFSRSLIVEFKQK